MKLLRLSTATLALDLCPALGGSIAAFRWQHPVTGELDLLRPMRKAAQAAGDVEASSAFPLTPFSNRVRDGRFTFQGRYIAMPRNTAEAHVEHGHGWQRPWLVASTDAGHAVLRYVHTADTWPFSYEMEQRFQLDDDRLTIDLATRNCGDQAMPYGLGLHPYFVRTPACTLHAGVTGFWESDAEVMPTRHTPVRQHLNPNYGLHINSCDLDNTFTGWNGEAEIRWPERNTKLSFKATRLLGFLVVYAPPGEDFFCAEPVSNCTDAFNLSTGGRTDTGMLILEPGEQVSAQLVFIPRAMG